MAPNVEFLFEGLILGEGPHWDESTQSLYFTDILAKTIHRYVPKSKMHYKALIGQKTVSIIIPIEGAGNRFLISHGRDLAIVKWDGVSEEIQELTKISEVDAEPECEGNQLNDGKCDYEGRLWIGSGDFHTGVPQPNKGGLFSMGSMFEMRKHLSNISLSNGMEWDVELKKFYYIDSPKKTIDQYDIDLNHGSLSDYTSIFTLEKHKIPGMPDGMTIDTNGNLWVAIFSGSRVIQIDPRRPETLLQTIDIPIEQVTSVAFGGPDLDELYVTSGSVLWENGKPFHSQRGSLFKVTGIDAKGFPGRNVIL